MELIVIEKMFLVLYSIIYTFFRVFSQKVKINIKSFGSSPEIRTLT